MSFLVWHYRFGVPLYFKRWLVSQKRIAHYFALPVLIVSLFAPWKRMAVDEETGFNLERFFSNLSFNLISRGIGFIVRFFLITVCLIISFLNLILGIVLAIVWIVIPLFSLPDYLNYQQNHQQFITDLVSQIKSKPDAGVNAIFHHQAGKYLLSHLGQDITPLIEKLTINPVALGNLAPKTYEDVISWLLTSNPDFEPELLKLSLNNQDLLLAAKCWDQLKINQSQSLSPSSTFDYPGIGSELITGYTPKLNVFSENYSFKQSFTEHLVGRQDIVNRLVRVLQSGKNVILVGQPGVGKKTVIHEFVHRASTGQLDHSLAYARVVELNYQRILSLADDLNQQKNQLANVLSEAVHAGNIILVIKDIQRLTSSVTEGQDLTDIFDKYLEEHKLKIIAVVNTVDYDRFLANDRRIMKYFEPIEVVPPSKDEALILLIDFANKLEAQKKIIITAPALKRILDGSDRYITDIPFPEKTLSLLEEVVNDKKDKQPLTVDEVDRVLSEKTGISLTRLTDGEQNKLANLEDIIHQELVDQKDAISLIAQSLRGRTMGIKNEDRPVGSFLFLGPTGVGKTQTAKALANVYYGDKKNIIRFDMAEYVGPEGVTRLIGSVDKNMPGELTNAIKNHPACLLLLDEIEKCPPEIFNFFLTLLDEGYIIDAAGQKINCKNIFVIATSNAGAEFIREQVSQGVTGNGLRQQVIDHVQQNHYFSPEFLNRFDGIVVYQPLSTEDMVKVTELQLKDLQKTLLTRNIVLKYTPEVCQRIATEGYDPALGARPMRRIIDLTISDLISRGILSKNINTGDQITLVAGDGVGEYKYQKTNSPSPASNPTKTSS